MSAARSLPLWSLVLEHAAGQAITIRHVGAAARTAAGADGAAVVLVTGPAVRETLYAGDQLAARVEELTLTLGEGPGMDALTSGAPVLVSDLADRDGSSRWPVFAPAVVALGARALFVVPLRIGAIRIGVLSLYRTRPGVLTAAQVSGMLAMADYASLLLLDETGKLAGTGTDPTLAPQNGLQHPEVHQATGMMSVQLGVSTEVAFIRLRAYAYSHDRRLRDVATAVVARQLRFEPDPGGEYAQDR